MGQMASRMTQFRSVAPALVEQRTAERRHVEMRYTSVRRRGGKPIDARLRDISLYGCRVDSSVTMRPGTQLMLHFPTGAPVAATVMWSDAGITGCKFDTPIARDMVRALALPTY